MLCQFRIHRFLTKTLTGQSPFLPGEGDCCGQRHSGQGNDLLFLDFLKAFDKVPAERLLKKVKAHGIGEQIYNWIKAWLTDRKQRVVLNGVALAALFSGVPLGSVGPLLFLLLFNDLDLAGAGVEIGDGCTFLKCFQAFLYLTNFSRFKVFVLVFKILLVCLFRVPRQKNMLAVIELKRP